MPAVSLRVWNGALHGGFSAAQHELEVQAQHSEASHCTAVVHTWWFGGRASSRRWSSGFMKTPTARRHAISRALPAPAPRLSADVLPASHGGHHHSRSWALGCWHSQRLKLLIIKQVCYLVSGTCGPCWALPRVGRNGSDAPVAGIRPPCASQSRMSSLDIMLGKAQARAMMGPA